MSEKIFKKDVRDAFFDRIYELACEDKDLIFITADAGAFSLKRFQKDFPERFINVGVAEQAMVLLATGLAMSGKNVFIYSIIPFITQRALEHIKVNICSMNLPVTIIGCGAGLSFGFDGPTHHGNQDIAAINSLPNIKIFSPCDAMSSMLAATESYKSEIPSYVRLDKGYFPEIYKEKNSLKEGYLVLKKAKDYCIVTTGYMTSKAIEVANILDKKFNHDIGIIDVTRIKPINENIQQHIKGYKNLYILEEHSRVGGLTSLMTDFVADKKIKINIDSFSLPDKQIFDYGQRDWIHKANNIDVANIVSVINSNIKLNNSDLQ